MYLYIKLSMHGHCWDCAFQHWRVKYVKNGAAGNIHPRIQLLKALTVIPENFPGLWNMNILKFGEERDSVAKFAHQKCCSTSDERLW